MELRVKASTGARAGWLLAWMALVSGPGSALAQDAAGPARETRLRETRQRLEEADANLQRHMFRAAVEGYEEVIEATLALRVTDDGLRDAQRLQRWEERAQLQIASARIEQGEPELARRRLQRMVSDTRVTESARARAREALSAMEEAPPVEDDPDAQSSPIDLDLGTALLIGFGVLEAALVSVGVGLIAAGWCEDPDGFMVPSRCDHTVTHVGIGFAIAGSVWWIVPAVIGGFMNQARRSSIGTPHPEASLGSTSSL